MSDDLALVKRAQAGDRDSSGKLFTKYRPVLFQYAMWLTGGNEDNANDLVQEACTKAIANLSTFTPPGFYSWLRTILRNCLTDQFRKKVPISSIENLPDPMYHDDPMAEEILEEARKVDPLFLEAVGYVLMGDSDSEYIQRLAEKHGITPSAVKNRMYRIRRDSREASSFLKLIMHGKVSRRGVLAGIGGIACTLGCGEFAGAFESISNGDGHPTNPLTSDRLVAFKEARSTRELIEALRSLDLVRNVGNHLRAVVAGLDNPNRIRFFEMGIEVKLEQFWTNPKVAALAETFLVGEHRGLWVPDRVSVRRLGKQCENALDSDRLELIASIETAANILIGSGKPEIHRRLLQRALEDTAWREHYYRFNVTYHGSSVAQLSPYWRHLADKRRTRTGLLGAVGAPVVVHHLIAAEREGNHADFYSAKRLLQAMAARLKRHSEHRLLDGISAVVPGLYTNRASPD